MVKHADAGVNGPSGPHGCMRWGRLGILAGARGDSKMGIDEETIEETASYVAIQRLLAAYADTVNRRAWGELSELFLEDATIDVTPLQRPPLQLAGPEALGRFIDGAIERFDFFQFVFHNSRLQIQLDANEARARNYISEYRRETASGEWTQVFGVYHDRYRRIEGRWWFEHRSFSPLASSGSDNRVFAFPTGFEAILSGNG